MLTTVSRVIASSAALDMTLSLDIATDIYPVHTGQTLAFQLVSSLRREKIESDTAAAADRDAWRLEQDDSSLAKDYDYVMYGKVRRRRRPSPYPRSSSTTSAAAKR